MAQRNVCNFDLIDSLMTFLCGATSSGLGERFDRLIAGQVKPGKCTFFNQITEGSCFENQIQFRAADSDLAFVLGVNFLNQIITNGVVVNFFAAVLQVCFSMRSPARFLFYRYWMRHYLRFLI